MSSSTPIRPPGRARAPARNVKLPTLKRPETLRRASQSPAPVQISLRTCAGCDEPNIKENEGQMVCLNCGTIAANYVIVNEVTFGETSQGGATVQGATVGQTQRTARGTGAVVRHGGHSADENNANHMRNAKEEMTRLANSMYISSMVDRAFRYYELGRVNHFQRPLAETISICLYIACRQTKGNTTLLIDFAEKIRQNVFDLGASYKRFIHALGVQQELERIPVVEIEPLLYKFAKRLEFGPSTRQVANDAAAILARMDRDWMVTGRQPPALCGAALILAARMNNFRRTVREVVYVVRAGDGTILKRLDEFRRTRAGALTVSQFREFGKRLRNDAEEPPSVWKARERERKLAMQAAEEAGVDMDLETTPSSVILHDKDGFAIPGAPASAHSGLRRGRSRNYSSPVSSPSTPGSQSSLPIVINDSIEAEDDEQSSTSSTPARKKRRSQRPVTPPPLVLTEEDLAAEEELGRQIEQVIDSKISDSNDYELSLARARSLATAEMARERLARELASRPAGRKRKRKQTESDNEGANANESEQVDNPEPDPLDNVSIHSDEFESDPEVSTCLLSEVEIAVKEKIWVTHNEDWLRRQQERHLNKLMEQAKSAALGKTEEEIAAAREKRAKNKEARRQQLADIEARKGDVRSAADATALMLEKKHRGGPIRKTFSAQIDYAVLQRTYGLHASSRSGSVTGSVSESDSVNPSRATTPASSILGAESRVRNKNKGRRKSDDELEEVEETGETVGSAGPVEEDEEEEEEEGFQEHYEDEEYGESDEDSVNYEEVGLTGRFTEEEDVE